MTREKEKIEAASLEWNVEIDPPLPGFYKMNVEIKKDLKEHDDRLDDDFKMIYSDPMSVLGISVVDELVNLENPVSSPSFLRDTNVMDQKYFMKKNEREEVFKRHEQKSQLEDLFNYQEQLKNSFKEIQNVEEGEEDVVETYPLFPSIRDNFIMITGANNLEFNNYKNLDVDGIVNRILVNGEKKNLILQKADTYLCINIKEGKAFYSYCEYIHKMGQN